MAIVKGNILYDSKGNILKDRVSEILTCLPDTNKTTDIPEFTFADLEKAIRSFSNMQIIKVYLLNNDETLNKDITGSIDESTFGYSEQLQSGQRRSMNFSLYDTHGEFFPNPNGGIWYGVKAQLFLGLLINDYVYYFPKGIFSVKDIGYSNKMAKLQFADKFATIDGTISGMTESVFKLVVGTPIKEAATQLLTLCADDRGSGEPYDQKTILFPDKYSEIKLPYTITYDYERSIGELLLELSEIISCDLYYDELGHLVFEQCDDLIDVSMKTIQWFYLDGEMQFYDTDIGLNFSDVYNKVMVVGSHINGYLNKAICTNDNPASSTSIGNTPVRFLYISDSNIYSTELCETRAKYELQKQSLLSIPLSFKSVYIPFLEVGNLVTYTDDSIVYENSGERVFDNEKIIITSISLDGNRTMTVQGKNTRELPFYG